jgi:hypothetical protein
MISQLDGNVAQIAAGSSHVVAIDTTGRTWSMSHYIHILLSIMTPSIVRPDDPHLHDNSMG